MRKGFGIIHVILIIVIVSGMLALALRYAKITVRHTSDSYLREEAELFMRSSVELALYSISGYDRKAHSNCLAELTINSPKENNISRFIADINITDYYLFGGSDDYVICDGNSSGKYDVHPIDTEESHGLVMLEITVRANPNHPKNKNRVRIVRRTLQKI